MPERPNTIGLRVGTINAANTGFDPIPSAVMLAAATEVDICVIPEILPATDYDDGHDAGAFRELLAERSRNLRLAANRQGFDLSSVNYDDTRPRRDRRQLGLTIAESIQPHIDDVSTVRFGGRNAWQVNINASLLGKAVVLAGVHAPDRPSSDRAAFIEDVIAFSREHEDAAVIGDLNENSARNPRSRMLELAGKIARLIPQTEPMYLEDNPMTVGRASHLLQKGGEIARGRGHDRLVAAGLTPAALAEPTMKLLGMIPMTPDGVYTTSGLHQSDSRVVPVHYTDHAAIYSTIAAR